MVTHLNNSKWVHLKEILRYSLYITEVKTTKYIYILEAGTNGYFTFLLINCLKYHSSKLLQSNLLSVHYFYYAPHNHNFTRDTCLCDVLTTIWKAKTLGSFSSVTSNTCSRQVNSSFQSASTLSHTKAGLVRLLPGQRRRDPDNMALLPWRPVWLCILMAFFTYGPPLNYSLGPPEEQALLLQQLHHLTGVNPARNQISGANAGVWGRFCLQPSPGS